MVQASDFFGRTVALGSPNWGTADIGGAWTRLEGSATAYAVQSGLGQVTPGAAQTSSALLGVTNFADGEVRGKIRWTDQAAGGVFNPGSLLARLVGSDAANTYQAILRVSNTTQDLTLEIRRHLSGSSSLIGGPFTLAAAYTPGDWWWVRFSLIATALKAKAWIDGQAEPGSWQVSATDANHIVGAVGYKYSFSSGNTVTPTVYLDEFTASDLSTPHQFDNAANWNPLLYETHGPISGD